MVDPVFEAAKQLVPPLLESRHKGQAGKIAVIGGCAEYTGAPFFSAFSALRVGADLSHVFCTRGAATVIKSYSPDLIVHPYLPDSYDHEQKLDAQRAREVVDGAVERVEVWLDKFDAVVVGPGMGRDPLMLRCVGELMQKMVEGGKLMIVDADGLWLANQLPDLLRGASSAVLTPNVAEFRRLADAYGVEDHSSETALQDLVAALGGPTIVRKGRHDVICSPSRDNSGGSGSNSGGKKGTTTAGSATTTISCAHEGSPRRAGGQGDVLTGCIAVFCSWAVKYAEQTPVAASTAAREATGGAAEAIAGAGGGPGSQPLATGAYLACCVARRASRDAFSRKRRSMVAHDVMECLPDAMQEMFPVGESS